MGNVTSIRKQAIRAHKAKTEVVIKEIKELAASMDNVGLVKGSETLYTIASSLQFDLNTLMTTAQIDKKD